MKNGVTTIEVKSIYASQFNKFNKIKKITIQLLNMAKAMKSNIYKDFNINSTKANSKYQSKGKNMG